MRACASPSLSDASNGSHVCLRHSCDRRHNRAASALTALKQPHPLPLPLLNALNTSFISGKSCRCFQKNHKRRPKVVDSFLCQWRRQVFCPFSQKATFCCSAGARWKQNGGSESVVCVMLYVCSDRRKEPLSRSTCQPDPRRPSLSGLRCRPLTACSLGTVPSPGPKVVS